MMMPTEDKTAFSSSSTSRRATTRRRLPLHPLAFLSAFLAASHVMVDAFETPSFSTGGRPTARAATALFYAPATASPVYSDHHTSRTTDIGGGAALMLDHADTDVSSKMTIARQRQRMIQVADATSTTTSNTLQKPQSSIQRGRRLMQMGSSSSSNTGVKNTLQQKSQPKIIMSSGQKKTLQVKNTKTNTATSKRTTATARRMVSLSSTSSSRDISSSSGRATTPSRHSNSIVAARKQTTTMVVGSSSALRTTNKDSNLVSSGSSSGGLTREEEVQFSFQIRTLRAAVRLRDQMMRAAADDNSDDDNVHKITSSSASAIATTARRSPQPPTEREWAQACGTTVSELRRLLYEGQEARTAMCNANVGLVTSIAKRHYHVLKEATRMGGQGGIGTILGLQDFIQEGNLGLMEAAERFEPEKGFRFSTYATYWIRQRILRSISDSSRTIRLPAHVHGILQKIHKAKRHMRSVLGREATLPELARLLEMSPAKVQLYTESSRNVVSLEVPLYGNGNSGFKNDRISTLGDTLASDAPTPEEDAQAEYLRRDVAHVIQTELTERERAVLQCRFGLCPKSNHQARSVAETALELGLTSDRVRLVEARALNKLRHPQRNYRLKEYVVNDYHYNHHQHASVEDSNNANNLHQPSSWGLAKTATMPTTTSLSRRHNAETTTRTTVVEGYDLATLSSSSSLSGFSSSSSITATTATLDDQQQDAHHHRSDRRWFF